MEIYWNANVWAEIRLKAIDSERFWIFSDDLKGFEPFKGASKVIFDNTNKEEYRVTVYTTSTEQQGRTQLTKETELAEFRYPKDKFVVEAYKYNKIEEADT